MRRYLSRIAALLSQAINCVVLLGHHDMTVSARCYMKRNHVVWGILRRVINAAFFWENDHCKKSHERDVEFAKEMLR